MKVQMVGAKPKFSITLPDSYAMRLIEQGKAVPVRQEAKPAPKKGKAKEPAKDGE
jgi:hypothetical protein